MIYFIQQSGSNMVKIGYTSNSGEKRLGELQTGNPNILELIACVGGSRETERLLHSLLQTHHIRGEWYSLTPDQIHTICTITSDRVESDTEPQVADFTKDKQMTTIQCAECTAIF